MGQETLLSLLWKATGKGGEASGEKTYCDQGCSLCLQLHGKIKGEKVLLDQLRNKGDFKHNTKVLKKGKGQVVTCKQPSINTSVND